MSDPWYEQPGHEALSRTIERLAAARGEEIAFMVLFGSRARGDWARLSDWDLLLGLRGDDQRRFVDRLAEFDGFAAGPVDVLVYSRSEWEQMAAGGHLTLLDALDHGVALHDGGEWARLQREFHERVAQGILRRIPGGWLLPPAAAEGAARP